MTTATDTPPTPSDPAQLLRDRRYVLMLVMGALVGAPVAGVAYFILKGVAEAQHWVFATLPGDLGFDTVPDWWPLWPLPLAGLLVALSLRYLPGSGGHKPAEGFKASGPVAPRDLPGIFVASMLTLCLGVVLGPEAPLIAIGSGLGVLAIHLLKRDAPDTAVKVIAVAGSFAAISTLLGSPVVGAFLLMEVSGLGGPMLGVVLVPGLLAAGIGTLIFVGLDNWTGYGTFSLAIPNIPPFTTPTFSEFLWAIVIGLSGALVGMAIKRASLALQPVVEQRTVTLMPLVGLGIGVMAVIYGGFTDHTFSDVLFSGQDALPGLIAHAGAYTAGALILLGICKGVGYALALSCFRGGPVFPGMFIGAAGGIALSHLPGLPMIAGAAMGIGALSVAMLGLPLTSALLPLVLLSSDGISLSPLVIVAVVVAYVASARLVAAPASEPAAEARPQPAAVT
ncbi:MAG: chloride channel protein [Gaiellales bacterium]